MSYPILYGPSETAFTSNGLGALSDVISCVVSEERNGLFELELTYPVTGRHFSEIAISSIIAAEPAYGKARQPFRIYKMTSPINGRVTFFARHISYQLSFIPTRPFTAASLADALTGLKTNAAQACPFTLTADFTNPSSYVVLLPASIRSLLGGNNNSILAVYGGEWEWNGYNCILHQARGANRGVTLRYGKNLTDLTQEKNIEETYTAVLCYWKSTEDGVAPVVSNLIPAPTVSNYPFTRSLILDVSNEFDNQPTVAQLNAYATQYITDHGIGVPSVSLKVEFIDLARTMEYKDIAPLESVYLCDTVTVIFEKLGISTTAKVVSTTYDVLAERYTSIELGDPRSTLAKTIEDQIQTTKQMLTKEETAREIDRATGMLNAGTRGHVIINRNSDGYANEILFLDNSNVAQAQYVLRINMNGIGFSSTGYAGPYYQAWTMDGTLSLGGIDNNFGTLQILDSDGEVIGKWDVEGIEIDEGTIGDFELTQRYGRQILQSIDERTGISGQPNDPDGYYLYAGWRSNNDFNFAVNDRAQTKVNGQFIYNGTLLETLISDAVDASSEDDATEIDDEFTNNGYASDGTVTP